MNYWKFITRPLPTPNLAGLSGFEANSNFVNHSVFWSLFFIALNILVPILTKMIFSKWYNDLDKRKKNELPSYVVCLIHHVAMVPTAWIHIYNDSLLTTAQSAAVHYGIVEGSVAPFCVGYLVGDTVCFALPEALRHKFEYIIHHTLTLWLVLSTIVGPANLCRFIPHLLICDTTNIFFNIAWLLRTAGYRNHPVVTVLESLFAVTFLFTRVINMPFVFLMISINADAASLGYARFTLLPISLLQWYWFSKIATTLVKKLRGTATDKEIKTSDSGKKKLVADAGDKSSSRIKKE